MDYRQNRISLGLTQALLAQMANVSRAQVSRLESGKTIDVYAQMRIAQVLDPLPVGPKHSYYAKPHLGCMGLCVLLFIFLLIINS